MNVGALISVVTLIPWFLGFGVNGITNGSVASWMQSFYLDHTITEYIFLTLKSFSMISMFNCAAYGILVFTAGLLIKLFIPAGQIKVPEPIVENKGLFSKLSTILSSFYKPEPIKVPEPIVENKGLFSKLSTRLSSFYKPEPIKVPEPIVVNKRFFSFSNLLIVGGFSATAVALTPIALGFGITGVASGTVAALWQASIGNVAAGSLFAHITSFIMGGTATTVATTGISSTIIGFFMKFRNLY